MSQAATAGTVRSTVPARIDRLPWSRVHWLVVLALGTAWVLDGLEIQMAASIASVLTDRGTLHLTAAQVGFTASVYLLGEVVGALFFGRMSDRFGRRNLFIITIAVYLIGNALSGLAFDFWSFILMRFIAGAGIGGEYAAVNSAIDELIPAPYRGRVDIAINGTYWFGAAIGAAAQILLLDPDILPKDIGWRVSLLAGPLIGLAIWRLRRHIPESPRWLLTHGRAGEADRIVTDMERDVEARGAKLDPVPDEEALEIRPSKKVSYSEIARVMLREYPSRSTLGFALMVTQSFLYNAIFFTYGLVLARFYGVADERVPMFFFPFALGNLAGPLLLGPLFDTIGRRIMITSTYLVSATVLAVTGYLFWIGVLTALTQTILWCVMFFFASAGASSGYLTVSEIFPLELRAQAISFFFAIAQFAGGVIAPAVFGALIAGGEDPTPLFLGYLAAAGLMATGGVIAWFLAVDAERRSLESIAAPLSQVGRRVTAAARATTSRIPPARRSRRER